MGKALSSADKGEDGESVWPGLCHGYWMWSLVEDPSSADGWGEDLSFCRSKRWAGKDAWMPARFQRCKWVGDDLKREKRTAQSDVGGALFGCVLLRPELSGEEG